MKPPADEMRAISRSLWVAGLILTFDECRLRSKARGDRYKNRNAKKPIKIGKDIHTLADAGEEADGYVLNEIVYAGEHTYTNNDDPRMYNLIKQALEPYYDTGRICVADNAYASMHALERSREDT